MGPAAVLRAAARSSTMSVASSPEPLFVDLEDHWAGFRRPLLRKDRSEATIRFYCKSCDTI
jgi:hypothetical protein